MLPDESDYIQPTFKADRDWLHLETRYAYEDRKSLSSSLASTSSSGRM